MDKKGSAVQSAAEKYPASSKGDEAHFIVPIAKSNNYDILKIIYGDTGQAKD